jgi:phosphohistidine swiveling domain-containing protein
MINKYSKGGVLKSLVSRVSLFNVPELLVFETSVFHGNPDDVVNQIKTVFCGRPVVVRSSAADEDGKQKARAGEYASVLNVHSGNRKEILSAIATVVASYARKNDCIKRDEFIVQEFLRDTIMSGVVFTHDLNTGAPYYVINYDDVSGLTNTVTSGGGEYANRTLYIHRGAIQALRSERFQRLLLAIQELERLVGSQFLDIEFAMGADLIPYLLQVRSITTKPHWNRAVSKRIDAALQGVQAFVRSRLRPVPGIQGKTTVLGQMPDWNPAEMIGRAPRALAFSLYRTLITDRAWSEARKLMGYAVPGGHPLMVSLAGQPFIDTRLSFNSFLPSKLSPIIREKLVDAWVTRLRVHPELHDKIEFEVAITTYSFDIDEKIEAFAGEALSPDEKTEFKKCLLQQARTLLMGKGDGSIDQALAQIEELRARQATLRAGPSGPDITALFAMIDDCIRLGTVPFSVLARHGFIARTILLSLERRGILTLEDIQTLQSCVRTVTSKLVDDLRLLQSGGISYAAFMAEYGHLRPGTYDILSHRYDQLPDFAAQMSRVRSERSHDTFALDPEKLQAIDSLLNDEGLSKLNAEALLAYVRSAIVGREYGKFVFTRSVSDILESIAAFGVQHGLSREELSHVPLNALLDILTASSEDSLEEKLRKISEEEAERHVLSVAIRLPQILFDEEGVHVVPFQVSHPNFITHKTVTAECVWLSVEESSSVLDGKIVLIENADPGFDWIFSHEISGLVTKYGGANSHMAIRCAEFGIPAAIGCGEQRFDAMLHEDRLLLDCAAGLIKPLN